MTTVPEFRASVLKGLAYLDSTLPTGSHVAFMPLVDGRILWNNMHERIHPIGVPYPAVYELLSCVGSNPCWGWLNSNEVSLFVLILRAPNFSLFRSALRSTDMEKFHF
jgi:acyloxyacyl hydrolase